MHLCTKRRPSLVHLNKTHGVCVGNWGGGGEKGEGTRSHIFVQLSES